MNGVSLAGKVALVTGASRGIGRAIAIELARAGVRVGLNYRSADAEAEAVANEIASLVPGSGEGNAMLLRADVSVSREARSAVDQVVQRWGQLDILVNNAGITRDRLLRRLSDEEWEAVINTNLNSVFYCTSAATPVMIQQNYGRIVNISSAIAQIGNVGQTNYAAAKGGIISFTRAAALELARYNITVNVVAPGFTSTEMLMQVPENIQDQIKAKIPLARFARPEEVARAVLFLATDGDYITGHQLNVNGGVYM